LVQKELDPTFTPVFGLGRAGQTVAARAYGHGSPSKRARKSKHPKSTPFVPNFSYLSSSIFHTISNVGLKSFDFF